MFYLCQLYRQGPHSSPPHYFFRRQVPQCPQASSLLPVRSKSSAHEATITPDATSRKRRTRFCTSRSWSFSRPTRSLLSSSGPRQFDWRKQISSSSRRSSATRATPTSVRPCSSSADRATRKSFGAATAAEKNYNNSTHYFHPMNVKAQGTVRQMNSTESLKLIMSIDWLWSK